MIARDITLPAGPATLEGQLTLPDDTQALVAFAHGSGSSRFSSRNRFVARMLNEAGLGTLLFDLLTSEEHQQDQFTREYRFDIPRLVERLVAAVDWLEAQPDTARLPLGLFGASTGAAAALGAAGERSRVGAVVCRGGRPDLTPALTRVRCPVLLIVGGLDKPVIGMNQAAARQLSHCEHRLEIVPGATHLFEQPGTLEAASGLARDWFLDRLGTGSS